VLVPTSRSRATRNQNAGTKIVLCAIEGPNFPHKRAITSNVGEEPSVVAYKVLTGKGNYGFLISSIADLMLTTDCIIAEVPSDDKGQQGLDALKQGRLRLLPKGCIS
jgi:chaperonin GroEL